MIWGLAFGVPTGVLLTGCLCRTLSRNGHPRLEDFCGGIDLTLAALISLFLLGFRPSGGDSPQKPNAQTVAAASVFCEFTLLLAMLFVHRFYGKALEIKVIRLTDWSRFNSRQRAAVWTCLVGANLLGFGIAVFTIWFRGEP